MKMVIGKIYYSREDRIAELNDPNNQVQYDTLENDTQRVEEASGAFFDYVDQLEEKIDKYLDAMNGDGEDAASDMRYARKEFVESWTLAQACLSKLAWVMRVQGNEAYERMMNALRDGTAVDVSDL